MRPGSDAASMREWFISVILLLPAQPHTRGSVREARMCWPCGGSALYSTARPAKLWFWKLRSRPCGSVPGNGHACDGICLGAGRRWRTGTTCGEGGGALVF